MDITRILKRKWDHRNNQRNKKVKGNSDDNHCLTGCFKRIRKARLEDNNV